MAERRKRRRNVRSRAVTFDGDKCESAAAQPPPLPLSLRLVFVLEMGAESCFEVSPTKAFRGFVAPGLYTFQQMQKIIVRTSDVG